jgi:hypothetical protein
MSMRTRSASSAATGWAASTCDMGRTMAGTPFSFFHSTSGANDGASASGVMITYCAG